MSSYVEILKYMFFHGELTAEEVEELLNIHLRLLNIQDDENEINETQNLIEMCRRILER